MKRSFKSFLNGLVVALPALLISSSLYAQASQCDVKRDVGTKALDEATWKQLNEVYEDVGEKKYTEAYDQLQKMLTRAGRDNYLRAIIVQGLAQVDWQRENYDSALKYFEEVVELDALPNQAHFALMYQVAQLYFMKERFTEALDRLELWFCKVPAEKVTAGAWVLKASIYAQMEDYPETLKAIEVAIEMAEEPKEPWYQLKLASHYELEQYPQAAETLEVIIQHWPDKKMYWVQLSQIYFKLKQDERALAVMAMAYRKNLLDSKADVVYLSNLYSNRDVPYKAAEVLEKGIHDGLVEPTKDHWSAVADAWYAAEELEKSLVAYEESGKVASDGNIDLRRGYILIDLERWGDANQALSAALSKGGLNERKTGEAYLLRGMAKFNMEEFDKARSDWTTAGRYEKTRDSSRQWLNHLREELARRS